MASGKPIDLYEASENDLKSMEEIGNAERISDLKAAKKVFTLKDVEDVTQITLEQWKRRCDAGVVTIGRLLEEAPANLPTKQD
jgi:hypothetical protein